jgi:3-oxoacyl-[acyl-carrier-protein] synthase III
MDGAEAQAAARGPGFSVPGVRLRGVVAALPKRRLENAFFEAQIGADAVADVVKMIGVKARYWVDEGQTASDLCFVAAERLIETLGWERASVDALIFISQTFDQRLPATACVLHGRLGLAPHCQAFDVGLGCSGYVYGLWLASALIAAGCRRVLVLAGDTISRVVDMSDRATALLFGDAGSATAVEHDASAPPACFVLGSDGAGASNLIVSGGGFRAPAPDPRRPAGLDPEHLFMDGGEVFAFTLRAVPRLVQDTLQQAGRSVEEVDSFVLHQANQFMLRHLAKKIGAPERTPTNIDRYGNTSSASIPLLLATDLAERLAAAPSRLMLVGFGVGYSWGAALFDAEPLGCVEVVAA